MDETSKSPLHYLLEELKADSAQAPGQTLAEAWMSFPAVSLRKSGSNEHAENAGRKGRAGRSHDLRIVN
jgi:hypothetical protein